MTHKRVLALDLGHMTFKLVLLELGGSRARLLQARLLELPAQADATLREASLKQLLEGISLDHVSQVASVLNDPLACLQQVAVPPMPEGELLGAAKWELQRSSTISEEKWVVDVEVLGEEELEGAKKLKLLTAAVPERSVREHLDFLSKAGLKPTQLTLAASAVAGWVRSIGQGVDRPVAVLLMGGRQTDFLIVQNGHPLFTRKIPVAGNDLTQGMTGVLMTAQGQVGLSESEAETIKRSIGVPKGEIQEIGTFGISGNQLLALIRGNLERLAMEVERSIAFYGELTSGPAVSDLLVVGGSAHLKGLSEWLEERLKITVTVPEPLQQVHVDPAAVSGTASAMKLSLVPILGAALTAGEGMNLLPLEIREQAFRKLQRAALIGTATALLVGGILLRVGMGVYHQVLLKQIRAFELERSAIGTGLVLAKVASFAHQRVSQEARWEEVFKELSQGVPKEIFLTSLDFQERQLTLRGRVRSVGRASDLVLTDFIRSLGEGLFTQVNLTSSRQREELPKEVEFEIVCRLK